MNNRKDIHKRLNELYKTLKTNKVVYNKKEFSDKLGFNYNNLINAMNYPNSQYLSKSLGRLVGLMERDYNLEKTRLIQKNDSLDVRKILTEDLVKLIPEDEYMAVQVKDLSTAAGRLLRTGSNGNDAKDVKTRLIRKELADEYTLIVRAGGHSMDDGTKRSIAEGDELLIRLYTGTLEAMPIRQKLFVVNTIDGSVVKQIKSVNIATGDFVCHSFNPTYEDYIVNLAECLQLFTVEKKVYSDIIF